MSNRLIIKRQTSQTADNINSHTKFLNDLGKPTKRGIKKCLKCGTYNGTRGLVCKNKDCNSPFKETYSECDTSINAVRLVTGNARRVYSVLVKEKSPICRGFVQLPVSDDGGSDKKMALCFVDSCQCLFDNSILKCHEIKQNETQSDNASFCPHIKSAVKSIHIAKTFDIKRNILERLQFSDDVRSDLLQLANKTVGALVQQVSKSVMAVKCHVSPKHPLGYLHLTFLNFKRKDASYKYCCNCRQFRDDMYGKNADSKCIHYYACIWAFASCTPLSKEFMPIIALELPHFFDEISPRIGPFNKGKLCLANLMNRKKVVAQCFTNKLNPIEEKEIDKDCCNREEPVGGSDCSYFEIDPESQLFNFENEFECSSAKRHKLDVDPEEITSQQIPSVNFIEWLSSVTERINLSLCSENVKKTYEYLQFQIPEDFFNYLKIRINRGSEISGQSFISNIKLTGKEQVQHLYSIFSAYHLKEIFDTPQVSLCLVKTVALNKNSIVMYLQVDRQQNVSNSNLFLIEWNPNVLPTSKFGVLVLKFKIGKFN